jgi:hypothetical protein
MGEYWLFLSHSRDLGYGFEAVGISVKHMILIKNEQKS